MFNHILEGIHVKVSKKKREGEGSTISGGTTT